MIVKLYAFPIHDYVPFQLKLSVDQTLSSWCTMISKTKQWPNIDDERIEWTKIKNTGRPKIPRKNWIIMNGGGKKYWKKKKNSRNISHTIIHVLTFEQQEQSNQSMQQHSYQITTSIHRNCCSGTPRNNQLCNINLHRGRNHPNKLSRIFHFTEPNSDYITQRSERSL